MKKFLTILIVLLMILNSCLTGVLADGGANAPLTTSDTINPYDNVNLHFGKKTASTAKPTINSSGVANNTDKNSYVKFDNVDFGADGARVFVLECGVPADYAGKHVLLYLCEDSDDANQAMETTLTSATKANDTDIINGADLDFVTVSTGNWTAYQYQTRVMTIEEAEKFKGVKDLYIAFVDGGTGNFKHFYFEKEYRNFNVDSIADDSEEYTATASFHLDRKVDLSLVSFATDSENKLKEIKEDDSETETEFAENMTFSIPKYDDAINVKTALIDKNLNCYGASITADENEYIGDIKAPSPNVKEGKIVISGTSDDDIVVIGLRKKMVTVGDFQNYMFVTPVIPDSATGKYEFTVDPSAITDVSGNPKFGTDFYCIDYSYFYDKNNDSEKDTVEFHFMTKFDEDSIISQLQNLNGDTTTIENVLNTAVDNNILIDVNFKNDLEYINNYRDKSGNENINKSYAFLANGTYSGSGDIYTNTKIQRILLELDNSQAIPDEKYENIYYQILEENKDVFGIEYNQDTTSIEDIYCRKYAESDYKPDIAMRVHNYAKDNIIKAIDDPNDLYDFHGYFQDAVILQTISETVLWGNIEELIKAYKDRLVAVADPEDNFTESFLEEYDALPEIAKQVICTELVGGAYQNAAAVAKAFRVSFDENKDYTEETDNGNQGSISRPHYGGGGGGGGGLSVTKPVEKQETPVNPPEEIQTNITNKIEFNDIGNYLWAEKQINYLAEKNIVNGKDNTTFAPADNITRAEFAKILVLTLGISTDDETVFKDIPNDAWYRPYVMAGYKYGIMTGSGSGVFNPEKFITREEAATMIYRATKKGYGNLNYVNNVVAFVDAESISDYAKEAISDLSKAGIINGNENNCVAPKANITRAETACLIYNYLMQF